MAQNAVYGINSNFAEKRKNEGPINIYGYSKYEIAKNIESRHRNIYNLRVFGIYGKYEDYKRRFISNNICRLLCGQTISINKNAYFDYLYVNDFSKIVEMFIKNNKNKDL